MTQIMISGIKLEVGQNWKEERQAEQAAAGNVEQAAAINMEQAAVSVRTTGDRQELVSKVGPGGQRQGEGNGCKTFQIVTTLLQS